MSKRVLSFMAHPDDCEFTCAGTLIRLKEEAGCDVAIATATSGDCGTKQYPPDEIGRIRHSEAVAAAKLIQADYYAAGSLDLLITYDAVTLRRFTEIVRKARPDIIVTHPPVDYLIDHEEVSKLVRMAAFAAPAPNFLTYDVDPAKPIDHVPHLYYAMPVESKDWYGRPVAPQFVIDVTEVMPLKEKMLACHASQREWLRAHHGIDEYIESVRRGAAAAGRVIGQPFGEGFQQHLGHGYPQDNIIAQLLPNA